jgi:AbiU2
MHSFQTQFLDRFKSLEFDSRACCTFVYTELTFDQLADQYKELSDRLTVHAMFWNGIMGGLQTASFAAMGRLYDTRTNTHNVSELLKFVQTYPGIFMKDALRDRKIGNGLPVDEATEFANAAFCLEQQDLTVVAGEASIHQAYYQEIVRPIRHQVFAHAGTLTVSERNELFGQLNLKQYQELVLFPLRLHRALRELYHNGRRLTLESAPTAMNEVLAKLPGDGPYTWEHLHVAERVVAMTNMLIQAPNPIKILIK